MKTELVFKLEQEPAGYGQKFSSKCKIDIQNTKGVLYLDYNSRYPIGMFENLRQNGEILLADITIFENFTNIEHRFEYVIKGGIVSKNENNECTNVNIESVAVLMPHKD